jgi:hypothetical protein
MGMAKIEAVNAALIVACAILVHFYPFHVLILSYAVLGPAHYLTEIGWLHQRQYFARGPGIGLLFIVPAGILAFGSDSRLSAFALAFAIIVSAGFLLSASWQTLFAAMFAAAGLAHFAIKFAPGATNLFILLVPSIVHVFVMTGLFMLGGAKRAKSLGELAVLALFFSAAASFFFISPMASTPVVGSAYFEPIVRGLLPMMEGHSADSVFGFLGFAYSYHYLNWFSKVEIIKWNRVPKAHLGFMAALYIGMLSAYCWSFSLGFELSLFMSMLHVLLEFPLNMQVIASCCRLNALPAWGALLRKG